jgi:hypothetical protein
MVANRKRRAGSIRQEDHGQHLVFLVAQALAQRAAGGNGRNPDDWVILLAGPKVQSVSWTAPGPISPNSASDVAGVGQFSRGVAVADIGQVTGPVELDQLDVGDHNLLAHPATVGVPGSAASEVPQLAAPGPITSRRGFRPAVDVTGQGTTATDLGGFHGHLSVLARCYGPGAIRLTFSFGAPRDLLGLPRGAAGPKQTDLGSMACDDRVHELVTKIRLRAGHPVASVMIVGSQLTSFRVGLGMVR